MNPIDQAILQDEIRQFLNALFKTGQVGREENAVLLDAVGNGNYFDCPGWANIDGSPVPFTPEVGKEYSVTLTTPSDTATFKIVASELDGIAVIGNPALMGAPNDTGEIFACATLNNQFICVWDVIYFEPNEVRVQIKSETIHPIDPKYLPGVCLPVVELSTEPTSEGAALTEAEVAAINALNGSPCILQFKYQFLDHSACLKTFASATVLNDEIAYQYETPTLVLVGASVSIVNDDGWKFYIR